MPNINDIQVLEGLEPIRLRPKMYVGELGRNHPEIYARLLEWAFGPGVQAARETKKPVTISIDIGDKYQGLGIFFRVEDNGPGMSVEPHPFKLEPMASYLVSHLFAGHSGYRFDNGGLGILNGLCSRFSVEVYQDGKAWFQSFEKGKSQGPMQVIGESNWHGNAFNILPDRELLENPMMDINLIKQLAKDAVSEGQGLVDVDMRLGADPKVLRFDWKPSPK